MTIDFQAWRHCFPVLGRRTYLNTGSYGALADRVREAIEQYLEERLERGADWDAWLAKHEAVREATARVLKVSPREIAVTASASAGINALASALDFTGSRRRVVVSDFEFPTHAQIWHAQERRGAEVVHVPAVDGDIPLESFARLIDERTQIVAVTHVCYRNGARLDVAGIARLAHARGARVVLDTYQAVGAIDIDARALEVDFMVGGMLKYLLGTAGIGFLYVRGALAQELVPSDSGWLAQEDIAAMDIYANRPAAGARRFEAGTPPVVNGYAAEAGLKIILEIGTAAIEARVQALTRRCLEGLEAMDWPAATPMPAGRRGPLVAVPAHDAQQLCARLLERGIVTSTRHGHLRASCHFYNDETDIDRFLAAMAAHRGEFRPRS